MSICSLSGNLALLAPFAVSHMRAPNNSLVVSCTMFDGARLSWVPSCWLRTNCYDSLCMYTTGSRYVYTCIVLRVVKAYSKIQPLVPNCLLTLKLHAWVIYVISFSLLLQIVEAARNLNKRGWQGRVVAKQETEYFINTGYTVHYYWIYF